MNAKLKRTVIELIIYGVVVVASSALFHIGQTTKPTTYHANGNVQFALISVPVPVNRNMEGHSVEYVITCDMKKSILECHPN